jgi:hypothetical protein
MNSHTEPDKKVYQKPTLTRYGNLAEMTKANSMAGSKDGGPSSSKTI